MSRQMSGDREDFISEALKRMWAALGGAAGDLDRVCFSGVATLSPRFAVSELAAACFAAAAVAVREVAALGGGALPEVEVDTALASAWITGWSSPVGWERGTPWHGVSTDYETADGRWLRLQGNYPHLRSAILGALGVDADPAQVAKAVRGRDADEVEAAVTQAGGTVAASRRLEEWAEHPQGQAVAGEPLVDRVRAGASADTWAPTPGRPLAGIRVLDCTRVLAGPLATRLLAGYGAEVLRLDPPGYSEPDGHSGGDLMLGKRCAFLDLKTPEGRGVFLGLLSEADVFVHGLRPGALEVLDLGEKVREAASPGLVEVALDAYGWSGPWAARRGFDTLVQTSTGLSTELMRVSGASRPVLLPSQVLDHGTGYLMAAAAVRGLAERVRTGFGSRARLALARTAALLVDLGAPPPAVAFLPPGDEALEGRVYMFPKGPVRRLSFPSSIEGVPLHWERPGDPYGTATPTWATEALACRRS